LESVERGWRGGGVVDLKMWMEFSDRAVVGLVERSGWDVEMVERGE
jgi:hypothetical protein